MKTRRHRDTEKRKGIGKQDVGSQTPIANRTRDVSILSSIESPTFLNSIVSFVFSVLFLFSVSLCFLLLIAPQSRIRIRTLPGRTLGSLSISSTARRVIPSVLEWVTITSGTIAASAAGGSC